jgi:glycosyltransferase involved in cell wall biosynthesis
MAPLLTICIPTYNRKSRLKSTIDSLLPQLTSDVELFVSDNASTDGTAAFLRDHLRRISLYRQDQNVGSEKNILACLGFGSGQYIWLLNDDDVISPNAVASILSAICQYAPLPLLWARAADPSLDVSTFVESTCQTSWTMLDGDSFLLNVAEWITFCPSIIVSRQCISIPTLETYMGSLLIPMALTLHAVAKENRVLVSDAPLILSQEGETGRYDVFTIFTHGIRKVCAPFHGHPFSAIALEYVYRSCYIRTIHGRIYSWPLSLYSSWNLLRYGLKYRILYQTYLPAIVQRFRGRLRTCLKRLFAHSV